MKKKIQIVVGDTQIRELQSELGSRVWPVFMQHDQTVRKHWPSLYTRFKEYQFAVFEENLLLGVGNALPLFWDSQLTELPDRGLDWAMEKANRDYELKVEPNILVGVQILVNPAYRGKGLSYQMLDVMKDIAGKKGLARMALPVRPTLKSHYPLIPMEDYMHWQNADTLPFDPWIRVHVRAGGKILHPCHRAMDISATVTTWESWTKMLFPGSGDYLIDQALVPVKIKLEEDVGYYLEPNVWIVHKARSLS